ncbi:MAG: GNAT family N-acetyltransferase [Proteobacteria bacterium]|nr:GNAT family N-acetyltransferase [Pseudomonadota bacterium]
MNNHVSPLKDGYTLVAPGKIASIATSLEMLSRPPERDAPDARDIVIRRVERPDLDWYLDLFRRIGEPWLWQARLRQSREAIAALLADPDFPIWALSANGRDEGLLELDFRVGGECEIAYFGLTPGLVGRGAGRLLMNLAIEEAWKRPIKRLWLHTCTLDHPGALAFYRRSGFVPYKQEVEISDDPRLDGTYPREAAPQVPILER